MSPLAYEERTKASRWVSALSCLQCCDTVGWVTGRTSGLQKTVTYIHKNSWREKTKGNWLTLVSHGKWPLGWRWWCWYAWCRSHCLLERWTAGCSWHALSCWMCVQSRQIISLVMLHPCWTLTLLTLLHCMTVHAPRSVVIVTRWLCLLVLVIVAESSAVFEFTPC